MQPSVGINFWIPMKQIKVSDYIAQFLKAQQIDHVFEVAGGMITHLLDSIHQLGGINIVSVHHEQAAAFAADASGRITGKPGVAFATSGPGATNLLTGIGSCYFDSAPALFITGQVNTHEQKGDRNIRQLGFQETDIITMAAPITKRTFSISSADQVERVMHEAYTCAISDRPGPVLIDLPMNVQRDKIDASPIQIIHRLHSTSNLSSEQLSTFTSLINKAKRPLLLVGGGVRCAQAEKGCIEFAERTNIPVVTSLLGLDIFHYSHPQRVGFIGTYGNRWANIVLAESDLLIVVGSRLDIRQTGADVESFGNNKTIIHIDVDPHEINNRIKNCIPIIADAKDFFREINRIDILPNHPKDSTWLARAQALRKQWDDTQELKDFEGINPNIFMHQLSQQSQKAACYIADVGNHQMWAAQSLELNKHQRFMTSGGMGAMGFALPAAMGATLELGKKPVVAIIGDGAFQMNIQELQTVRRNSLPIKIVVINNNCLGMIRQFQDSYFEGRYQSTCWGYSAPDFSKIAEAYGIPGKTIIGSNDTESAVKWLWGNDNEPALLQVMVSSNMNVYPKIAFGRPISEMEPFASPISIEST